MADATGTAGARVPVTVLASSCPTFVAVDLGASNVRVISGSLQGLRLRVREVVRRRNGPVSTPDGLRTDVLAIWRTVVEGLQRTNGSAPNGLAGVGFDGWGVDYGLVDARGALLANPRHYRDPAHADGARQAFAAVSREEVYAATGIQFLPFNTLNQLVAHRNDPLLGLADRLLLLPDLLGYWTTGQLAAEATNASTTQLWDSRTGDWAWGLLDRLELPRALFAPTRSPGARLGSVGGVCADEANIDYELPVWTVGSHDTASAVAAVPATGPDAAYISAGTWSLVGVEVDEPVRSAAALELNLTNELGVDGRTRLLKNVMGHWLVQQCCRAWGRNGVELDPAAASALAGTARPGGALIDPDRPEFIAPGNLPALIARACEATGQRPPRGEAATLRCIVDSLACRYRAVIEAIEGLRGRAVESVHIVGGGSQDATLCQTLADVLRRPVIAGPVEATAVGNLLVQADAAGLLDGPEQRREVVRRSFELRPYEPSWRAADMQDVYDRFQELVGAPAAVAS